MLEFKVNRFITLKLEKNKTVIYIKDEEFIQCKYLLIEIPRDTISNSDEFISIDDALEKINNDPKENGFIKHMISPEEEFIGHCSNLQAWYENGYDTCLLHTNIAFPLLKKLTEVGDLKAKKIFKEEIFKRILNGNDNTLYFLTLNEFIFQLRDEELIILFETLNSNQKNRLERIIIDELIKNPYRDKYKRDLYEILTYLDKKVAINLPNIEFQNEKFFLNGDKLDLTRKRKKSRIISISEILGLNMLNNLKSLTIKDHSLFSIDNLEMLSSLETLDLSRNKIEKISGLNKCTKIKKLNLNNNKIKEINNINYIKYLEYLDLSQNEINEIDGLDHLKHLQTLRLNGNNIKKIEGLDNLPNLTILNLANNNIKKIEGLDNLPNLTILNLANNNIKKIEGLDNLPNLKTLNVYGNKNVEGVFRKFMYDGQMYIKLSKKYINSH